MSFDYGSSSERAWGAAGWDTSALSRVLGLLGLAAAITAGGAFIGPVLGSAGFWISLVGGFVVLLVLRFARNSSPINMVLFVAFSALEGVVLGDVLEIYVAQG